MTLIHLCGESVPHSFQNDVDAFCEWTADKQLCINVDKTKSMTVSRKSCGVMNSSVCIDNTPVDDVECLKVLLMMLSV